MLSGKEVMIVNIRIISSILSIFFFFSGQIFTFSFNFWKFIFFFIGFITGKSKQIKKILSPLELDPSYAYKTLNWQPRFTFKEGLEKTVFWYLNQNFSRK